MSIWFIVYLVGIAVAFRPLARFCYYAENEEISIGQLPPRNLGVAVLVGLLYGAFWPFIVVIYIGCYILDYLDKFNTPDLITRIIVGKEHKSD